MPEATITTETSGRVTTSKWYSNYITPQTLVWILAAFVWAVIFWKDSKDNWDKVRELEKVVATKANAETVKDIDEKVTRQYSVQRDQNAQQDKQIEECLDWISWKKGYEQAQRDLKK